MMQRTRRRAVAAAALLFTLGLTGSANAATAGDLPSPGSSSKMAPQVTPNANVWVVAKRSDGWCNGFLDKVTYMRYTNVTTNQSGGDGGDDIVRVPVRTGRDNTINISVTCRLSTPYGMNFKIKPVSNNETWFVATNGTAVRKPPG